MQMEWFITTTWKAILSQLDPPLIYIVYWEVGPTMDAIDYGPNPRERMPESQCIGFRNAFYGNIRLYESWILVLRLSTLTRMVIEPNNLRGSFDSVTY